MSKNQNKTQATGAPVEAFLETVEPERRREEGFQLVELFRDATGWAPRMWGPAIVGFGQYHYKYESGREGDFLATGFSPRKARLSIYIMPGYANYDPILERLGKHAKGKSCLYLNKLADIDEAVLKELIQTGVKDLNEIYPVQPT